MERGTAIVLTVILTLLLALTACRAVDQDNLFELPSEDLATLGQTQAAEETRETKETPASGTDRNGTEDLSVPYQYGNAQKTLPSFLSVGDDILIFWSHSNTLRHTYLYSVNQKTLEVRFLCQDPTCGHDTAQCIACDKIYLEQYNGTLYAEDGGFSWTIKELEGGSFTPIVTGCGMGFAHAKGDLYVKTADNALLRYKNGGKKAETVSEEFFGEGMIVFENVLYASTPEFGSVRVDLNAEEPKKETIRPDARIILDTDTGTFYCVGTEDGCLYRCDENFQNEKKLVGSYVDFQTVNFDENYIYFCRKPDEKPYSEGGNVLSRMSKDPLGEPEIFAELPEGLITFVFTVPDCNYVFVQGMIPPEGEASPEFVFYAINKDTGEITQLEIPEI